MRNSIDTPLSEMSSKNATRSSVSLKLEKFNVLMLTVYVGLAPLGNCFRFSNAEGSYGITTIVLIFLVIINLIPSILYIKKNTILLQIALLIVWIGIASLFAKNIGDAYIRLSSLVVYLLLLSIAFKIDWSEKKIRQLLYCFVLSGFLGSIFTLVDFFGIINISGITKRDFGMGADGVVAETLGFFERRTAMAAYFSLLIPISFTSFLFLQGSSNVSKIFFLCSALACSLTLFLSMNRAGVLGAWISIFIVNFLTLRSIRKALRLGLILVLLIPLVALLLNMVFYEQFIAYQHLLGSSGDMEMASKIHDSDYLRVIFFKHSLLSIFENPIGNGYTLITGLDNFEQVDPHSNITQIIWAAGLFGIGWLIVFLRSIFIRTKILFFKKNSHYKIIQYGIVVFSGLLGWSFCGLTHTIIDTGVAWILLGLFLKITSMLSRRSPLVQE